MKFLIVASFPESLLGFRGALLESLKSKGIDVHVAAPDLPAGSALRAKIEMCGYCVHNIKLQRVGMNPLRDLISIIELWRLMTSLKPDAVLAYTVKPVVYGLLAARLASVPKRFALITGLGYAFQGAESTWGSRNWLRLIVQRLYALALRGANKTFFQNPDDQKLFFERALLRPSAESVVVNGSGVDLKVYEQSVPPTPISFLLIARLLGDKGIREYVEAARLIKKLHPAVRFNLVGWIDDNPDSISSAELNSWVTEGLVTYWGRLSDVRPAIESSSVYVLPSYREGTPRTVLEAMAMGRAIITTDAPGCRETVIDGLNGYLVEVKNAESLAFAMMRFVSEPNIVYAMGQESRRLAEEKFDVHAVNNKMLREMQISKYIG
ncbi:glycosyltransferase family 4 protein [Pseudomonas plecoglossicida]|uniref:Glycosyltransferase family 1 protein n=1 Tax=Pseudomonas plecoglossicida TaxID=70775 RepID=A0AAD0R0E6_PSEDL|nr:glycosyltransferase family 4 protein [Pseudomonas plecoglossicida]AXM99008.1 glycosyltransferase family 1 protein [Pseudomonas plecoglossicida]EPB97101.1 Glycosyl transferase, group 1 family protein [Pseudomonas plecoglossicida NB2011]QLB56710.1 glycosyltransferase family 4 protein [Pseudomonas plecoglossicida]